MVTGREREARERRMAEDGGKAGIQKRVTDGERGVMGEERRMQRDGKTGIWCDKKRKRYRVLHRFRS